MNHEQLNHTIQSIFQKPLLEEFHDDYGFTHKTNKDISTIGIQLIYHLKQLN